VGTHGRGDAGMWGHGDLGMLGLGVRRTLELRDAQGLKDVVNKQQLTLTLNL